MRDRKLFKEFLTASIIPKWPCPTCGNNLKLEEGSFNKFETFRSKEYRKSEGWEPSWIEYHFTAFLVCSDDRCGEKIACCGKGNPEQYDEWDEEGIPCNIWEDNFKPEFFTPHLNLFEIPKTVPEAVKLEIGESFRLFFADPAASGNRLRVSVEKLLDHLKIKRFQISKKMKKRHRLNLHQRIDLLPAKYSEIKDLLFAVKWIGNAGSHSSDTLDRDDVLDGYEIMEETIRLLFNSSNAKDLAKKINKSKGPAK